MRAGRRHSLAEGGRSVIERLEAGGGFARCHNPKEVEYGRGPPAPPFATSTRRCDDFSGISAGRAPLLVLLLCSP